MQHIDSNSVSGYDPLGRWHRVSADGVVVLLRVGRDVLATE